MSEIDIEEIISRSRTWRRGNRFEDFAIGRKFEHHWGRTITESDNTNFSVLTLNYNPIYTNREVAIKRGYASSPVNPYLLFTTVFGLSVEDLSEGGGPFVGVGNLSFLADVYPGETVYASSEVIAARLTKGRPGYGVVTWRTVGRRSDGQIVIEFERSNLVRQKEQEA